MKCIKINKCLYNVRLQEKNYLKMINLNNLIKNKIFNIYKLIKISKLRFQEDRYITSD